MQEEDEFAALFGSAPAPKTENTNTQHELPASFSKVAEQSGGGEEDEDLDYESDENEDNIVSEELLTKTLNAEENGKPLQKEENKVEEDQTMVDEVTGYKSKVIKDEQVEKLLSDVNEKYRPLFPGSSEPKINKQVLEQDLDDLESHPWRKPNANPEDYFNYGFDEETWRMYCKRQKDIRGQAAMSKPINVFTGFVSSERTKRIEDRDMDLIKQLSKPSREIYDEETEEAGLSNVPEEVINLSDTNKGSRQVDTESYSSSIRDRDTKDLREMRDTQISQRDFRDYRDSRDYRDGRDSRDSVDRGRGSDHRYESRHSHQQDRDYSHRDRTREYSRDQQYSNRRDDGRKRDREYSTHDYDRDYKRQRR